MSKFQMGNISGTSVQVGDHNQATVTMTQADREEIVGLIALLRQQIQQAALPEDAKHVLASNVLPTLEQASRAPDPKPGLSNGLARINDNLQAVGSATDKMSGIVSTIAKIAATAGIAFKTVAPWLAAWL